LLLFLNVAFLRLAECQMPYPPEEVFFSKVFLPDCAGSPCFYNRIPNGLVFDIANQFIVVINELIGTFVECKINIISITALVVNPNFAVFTTLYFVRITQNNV